MSTPEPTASDREKARETVDSVWFDSDPTRPTYAGLKSAVAQALAAVRAETVEQTKCELLEAEFIIAHTHDWPQFSTVAEREQYTLKKLKILERYYRRKPSPPKAGV